MFVSFSVGSKTIIAVAVIFARIPLNMPETSLILICIISPRAEVADLDQWYHDDQGSIRPASRLMGEKAEGRPLWYGCSVALNVSPVSHSNSTIPLPRIDPQGRDANRARITRNHHLRA